jgi:hypothetical protein
MTHRNCVRQFYYVVEIGQNIQQPLGVVTVSTPPPGGGGGPPPHVQIPIALNDKPVLLYEETLQLVDIDLASQHMFKGAVSGAENCCN